MAVGGLIVRALGGGTGAGSSQIGNLIRKGLTASGAVAAVIKKRLLPLLKVGF